jgi:hypothetical protein
VLADLGVMTNFESSVRTTAVRLSVVDVMLLVIFSGAELLLSAPKAYRLTKSEVTASFPLQLAKVVPGAALTVKITDTSVAAS